MRPSPLRHPVAVLRRIIGLSQQELADLVGRSRRTIQAVELGSLELSESLAYDITANTGINVTWLLAGDPEATPVNIEFKVYSKSDFESVRAQGFVQPEKMQHSQESARFNILSRAQMITAPLLMAVAAAAEKGQEGIAIYRIHELIRSLSKDFGWTSEELLQYAQHCRLLIESPGGSIRQKLGGAFFDDPRGKSILVCPPMDDDQS